MADRMFKITEDQREHVATCLRYIDRARKDLEAKGPGNEAICTELRNCADGIFHLMNNLEELK